MDTLTQKILDKFNQLSPKLQQEALNYIDFLIHRHGLDVSTETEKTVVDSLPQEFAENKNSNEDTSADTTPMEIPTESMEEIKTTNKDAQNTQEIEAAKTVPIEVEEIADTPTETEKPSTENESVEETASTPLEESAKQTVPKEEKEEMPSAEDLRLDEQIENIEQKKKDRIAPDWQEVKQAFKDEFL